MSRFLASISPMRVVSTEWWDRWGPWTIGFLGAFGIVNLVVQGWLAPTRFEVVLLGTIGLMWCLFSVLNGKSWRGTLKSWRQTLKAWEQTSMLVGDLTSLLDESLSDLSTYDRDKATDIVLRAQTIMKMRQQNIDQALYDEKEDVYDRP